MKDFKERVETAKKDGKEFIIINDTDNEIYESGFADWLMRNYHYSNMRTGCRINLNLPSPKVPGGEFADPNY